MRTARDNCGTLRGRDQGRKKFVDGGGSKQGSKREGEGSSEVRLLHQVSRGILMWELLRKGTGSSMKLLQGAKFLMSRSSLNIHREKGGGT